MFKNLLLVSLFVFFSFNLAIAANNSCLKYEPDVVELKGNIKKVIFPGPPNYESIKNGDEADPCWVLYLQKEICVQGNGDLNDDSTSKSESNVTTLQLMITDYKKYSTLLGKSVKVKGQLTHKTHSHHHTPVLLQVESIK